MGFNQSASSSRAAPSAPPPLPTVDQSVLNLYVSNPLNFLALLTKDLESAQDTVRSFSNVQIRKLFDNAKSMSPSFDYQLFNLVIESSHLKRGLSSIIASLYNKNNRPIPEGNLKNRLFSGIAPEQLLHHLISLEDWELVSEFVLYYKGAIDFRFIHQDYKEEGAAPRLIDRLSVKNAERVSNPYYQRSMNRLLECIEDQIRRSNNPSKLMQDRIQLGRNTPIIRSTSILPSILSRVDEFNTVGGQGLASLEVLTFYRGVFSSKVYASVEDLWRQHKDLARVDLAIIQHSLQTGCIHPIVNSALDFFNILFSDRFPCVLNIKFDFLSKLSIDRPLLVSELDYNAFSRMLEWGYADEFVRLIAGDTIASHHALRIIGSLSRRAMDEMEPAQLTHVAKRLDLVLSHSGANTVQTFLHGTQVDILALIRESLGHNAAVKLYNEFYEIFDKSHKCDQTIKRLVDNEITFRTKPGAIPDARQKGILCKIQDHYALEPRHWISFYATNPSMAKSYFTSMSEDQKKSILNEIEYNCLLNHGQYEFIRKDPYFRKWMGESHAQNPDAFISLMRKEYRRAVYLYHHQMGPEERILMIQNAQTQGIPLIETLIECFTLGETRRLNHNVKSEEDIEYMRRTSEKILSHLIPNARKRILSYGENDAFILKTCVGIARYGSQELKDYFLEMVSDELRATLSRWIAKPTGLTPDNTQRLTEWLTTPAGRSRFLPCPAYQPRIQSASPALPPAPEPSAPMIESFDETPPPYLASPPPPSAPIPPAYHGICHSAAETDSMEVVARLEQENTTLRQKLTTMCTLYRRAVIDGEKPDPRQPKPRKHSF